MLPVAALPLLQWAPGSRPRRGFRVSLGFVEGWTFGIFRFRDFVEGCKAFWVYGFLLRGLGFRIWGLGVYGFKGSGEGVWGASTKPLLSPKAKQGT